MQGNHCPVNEILALIQVWSIPSRQIQKILVWNAMDKGDHQ